MNASVRTVSFTLTGSALMARSRDLVLSGMWREALEMLKSSLEGMSTDQALSVLKGESALSGSSATEIIFEPDPDPRDYLNELDDKYGGLARIDGGLYRPYMVVTDYGPEDAPFHVQRAVGYVEYISERMHGDRFLEAGTIKARALHYGRNRHVDRVEVCRVLSRLDPGLERNLAVIFEPVHDVPVWVMPAKDAQAAVDKRFGSLHCDGYSRRYGTEDMAGERDEVRRKNQAKANFADMVQTFGNRDMRQVLDENLKAMADRSAETFDRRRAKILEQNASLGFGLRSFDFGGDIGIREIPEGPLRRWAIARTLGRDKAPEWTPVCPQGVKVVGDDPVHSDWVVAAGLENEDMTDGPLAEKQNDLMLEIQQESLGLAVNVLVAGRASATGTVIHAKPDTPCDKSMIAVISHAGPEYMNVARSAAAVIALKGGALSHLAVVGLEEGFLIVRDPSARQNYAEGTTVTVDAASGTVRMTDLSVADEGEQTFRL